MRDSADSQIGELRILQLIHERKMRVLIEVAENYYRQNIHLNRSRKKLLLLRFVKWKGQILFKRCNSFLEIQREDFSHLFHYIHNIMPFFLILQTYK